MRLATALTECVLRPWEAADKASLIANANNRRVWRNLADIFPHPYTEADADFWISFANSPSRSINFAIEFDGVAVGGVGARAGEGIFVRTAEFGYWLGEPYWGRGITTAAAGALLEHLRHDARFARLEAPVFEWNPASMRVLDKLGFVREAVKPNSVTKDGHLIGSVLYTYLFKH